MKKFNKHNNLLNKTQLKNKIHNNYWRDSKILKNKILF
jgi:hypothetical protein